MPSKIDKRHKEIGGRHRAQSRYHMIVHRVENAHLPRNSGYKGILVLVSKDEFIEWFMPRDFPGCSVDRIDNKGHYQLSNMQVIPLTQNIAKDRVIARDGVCRCYSCGNTKPINSFAVDKRRQNGRSTICKACDATRPKNISEEARARALNAQRVYYRNVTKPKLQALRGTGL